MVWSKDLYLAEGERQLFNTTFYKQRSRNGTIPNNLLLKNSVSKLIRVGQLPFSARNLTLNNSELGHPTICITPKIQKINNPGSPIVSVCACTTEQIPAYIDSVFQPLVTNLKTYIKDTNHAVTIFAEVVLPTNKPISLFVFDVTFLYTSIPHADLKLLKIP